MSRNIDLDEIATPGFRYALMTALTRGKNDFHGAKLLENLILWGEKLVNNHESGRTAMHIAVELESLPLSMLRVLVYNYPDDITKKDKYGNTPLSIAEKNKFYDVRDILREYQNMSPVERANTAADVKRKRDAYLAERAEVERRYDERREEARREEAMLNSNTGEVPEKFAIAQNYIDSIRTKKNIESENTGEIVAKKTNIAQKYLDSIRNKGGKSNKKRSRKHKLRRKRSLHKKK